MIVELALKEPKHFRYPFVSKAQKHAFFKFARVWRLRSRTYLSPSLAMLKRKGAAYSNLVCIRYEDLVARPDEVQAELLRRIPFLTRKAKFSQFAKIARPSVMAKTALGGVREIDTSSIGNWRSHLLRIKAQLPLYGPITDMLREFGYESDDTWTQYLRPVIADNNQPKKPPHSLYVRFREWVRMKIWVRAARMGYVRTVRANQP